MAINCLWEKGRASKHGLGVGGSSFELEEIYRPLALRGDMLGTLCVQNYRRVWEP